MLFTAGPRSPRLTITSLVALAPPEALEPGSASAAVATAHIAAHTASTAQILDTGNGPLSYAYEVS
jgi:hypothetical protein